MGKGQGKRKGFRQQGRLPTGWIPTGIRSTPNGIPAGLPATDAGIPATDAGIPAANAGLPAAPAAGIPATGLPAAAGTVPTAAATVCPGGSAPNRTNYNRVRRSAAGIPAAGTGDVPAAAGLPGPAAAVPAACRTLLNSHHNYYKRLDFFNNSLAVKA